MSATDHHFDLRVYYADTDAGGVVYHARYVEFLERARHEYMLKLGVDIAELAKQGVYLAVVEINIKYLTPGRLGERLQVRSRLGGVKRVSLECEQEIWSTERCLCEAKVRIACVDGQLQPRRFPDELATILAS